MSLRTQSPLLEDGSYPTGQSWQISLLTSDPPLQAQPSSIDRQSALHPSALLVFSSSHDSAPARLPSPQIVTQFSGLVGLS